MHNCYQNYYLSPQNGGKVWGGGAPPQENKKCDELFQYNIITWFGKCTSVINYSKLHSPISCTSDRQTAFSKF